MNYLTDQYAPDRYVVDTSAEQCVVCPAGSYQDLTGSIDCKKCKPLSYQDLEGQTYCKICNPVQTILLDFMLQWFLMVKSRN